MYTHIQTNARNHKRKNLNTHLFKSISLLYAWLGTKPSSDGIKYGAFEFVSSSLTRMTILYIKWDLFITIRKIRYMVVFSARRLTPLCNYRMIQVIENANIFPSHKKYYQIPEPYLYRWFLTTIVITISEAAAHK